MRKLTILILLVLSAPLFAGDPHAHYTTNNNTYTTTNNSGMISDNSMSAAMNMVDVDMSTRKLQLGGGIGLDGDNASFAVGGGQRINGFLVKGLFAKPLGGSNSEPTIGIGFRMNVGG